ncbi:CPCC family cysteine-rich protein [Actinokineospora sp.]|uniref:CPCC family cysteine-rich protein n=1 Tax=Actinokineospora sp. TaxID=1872133 RepID=UPI004037ECED
MTHVTEKRFPCPCCGRVVHAQEPGSQGVCPVCFWEDDIVQLASPEFADGANRISLIQAQRNYQVYAACELRFRSKVRYADVDEPLDFGFRYIDLDHDRFDSPRQDCAPRSSLYWWR